MASARTNLWRSANRFVGRAVHLERLTERLAQDVRLVTLVGPPGAGKSRLAQHFSELALGRDRRCPWEEVWFVDLTAAEEPTQVLARLADAVHIELIDAQSEGAVNRLAAGLSQRGPALVILDNIERLCDAIRPLLSQWMAQAQNVQWLATSRQRVRVAGEEVVEVGPMRLPSHDQSQEVLAEVDSVALLLERARAVGSKVRLDSGNAGLLVDVVRLLDGLPLAIEMAAARLNLLNLSELRRLLQQRFAVLADAAQPLEHHQTLHAAITWSWGLLDRWEREALAQCTVFLRGFELDAAERVVALGEGAPTTFEVVQRLRDQSLIQVEDGPGRHRLRLLLSIRDFATQTPEGQDGRLAATERHAAFYAELGRGLMADMEGPAYAEALRRLQTERENFVAVLDRAERLATTEAGAPPAIRRSRAEHAVWASLALHHLLSLRGPLVQAPGLVSRALDLARAEDLPAGLLARGEIALAEGFRRLGNATEAEAALNRAEELLRTAPHSGLSRRLATARATALSTERNLPAALAAIREAVNQQAASEDPHAEALAWMMTGVILRIQGDLDEGAEALRRSLAGFRRLGARRDEVVVLWNLAVLHAQQGDYEQAESTTREALGETEGTGTRLEAYMQLLAGVAAAQTLRQDAAESRLDRASQCYLRAGDPASAAFCFVHLAELSQRRGRTGEATQYVERARSLADPTSPGYQQLDSACRAYLAWESGDLVRAEEELTRRLDLERVSNPNLHFYYASMLAALACVRGDGEVARRRFDEIEPLRQRLTSPLYASVGGLYRGLLDAYELRAAADAGDNETVTRLASELADRLTAVLAPPPVDARSTPAPPPVERFWLLKLGAERLLSAIAPPHRPSIEARARDPESRALVVSGSGAWFRTPGGEPAELTRRPHLSRLLVSLTTARLDEGSRALPVHELVETLWPGESIASAAATQRVYYVVKALRKVGLGPLLTSSPDGYRLDPHIPVLRLSC